MPWQDVTKTDKFRSLEQKDRALVKDEYFRYKLLPKLQEKTQDQSVLDEAYNEFMERPDDTGEGLVRSMLGSAARGFLDPLAAVPEVAGAYTGIESLESLGGDIRGGIESAFPVNPAQQGLATDIAGVAGQAGQILATGGLGAASGISLAGKAATKAAQLQAARFGAKAAQQGAMGASAVAGGLERADQLGLEGGDRLVRGLLAGGTELATEKLGGFATELGPVNKLLGDSIETGFMKPVIRGILTESSEEGAAEVAGQATDIAMAPETAPAMDLKQIGYSMLLGGAGGAMFGGVEAAIAPKTAQAYKDSGAFVPVRNIADIPADIDAGDDTNLVYDKNDNLIGYKPKAPEATVETELPYEAPIEIDVDKQLPPEVQPEVEAMVANVAETPETTATAAALAEDTQSGIYDLGAADATANLLTGIPMQQPLGGVQQFDNAQLEGQPIEDEPLQETPLQQEQSSVEAVPQPRELPILPAEPTAQAPEAAVGVDAEIAKQQKVTKEVADAVTLDQNAEVRKQQAITNEQKQQEEGAATIGNLENQGTQGVSSRNIKSGGEMAAREQWALSELTTRATRDSTQSGPTLPPSATESPEAIEATLESLRKEFDSKPQDYRDSVIDFYSDTSNAKTSNQAQSPPQSPLGQEAGLSPVSAVKATESTGVGVSNVDDSVLSQWVEGKQPNDWVNVKSKYGEWSSTRNGVGWWIQAIPFNIGKSGKKVIKNVVFAPSGEISNAKSFSDGKSLKELQSAAESVENASRKRQGKPLLKQAAQATLEQQWQDSPQFAAAEEAAAAGDMERADAIEAEWRDAALKQKVTKDVAEDAVVAEGGGVRNKEAIKFEDDLKFYGTANIGSDKYTIKQGSDQLYYVERTKDGVREQVASGFPDIETAQQGAIEFVQMGEAVAPTGRQTEAAEVLPEKRGRGNKADDAPRGMSIEGSRQYLAERNKNTIFGYETESFLQSQRDKTKPKVSSAPTDAVPTESLPAGQPMSGDMGAAVAVKPKTVKASTLKVGDKFEWSGSPYVVVNISRDGKVRSKPTGGEALEAMRKLIAGGYPPETTTTVPRTANVQIPNATPPPPQQQQPATPATQETQPEAAASATEQPATEAKRPVEDPLGYGNALIALFPSLQKAGVTAISIEEAMKRLDAEWEKKQASGKATRLDQLVYMANKKNTQSALDGANIGGLWTRSDKTVAVSSKATPSAMAHEIGHAIMELEYANAPEATKKAIEAEYSKWFAAKYGKDGVPSVADQRRIWEWMTDADWMNPDAPFPQEQRVAKWEAYRSKFSEWFADEVAKWAATKDAPKSLVDKFFSELAQKLKKLWDAVLVNFSPNETLASWLDSISVASPAKAQQPAEETGDAGVTSASDRLRADIATLPAKAQAAWTPDILAVADSYYSSGDRSLLYKLPKPQRNRILENSVSAGESVALDIQRIAERKQREGKPIDDKLTAEEAVRSSIASITEKPESARAKAVQKGLAGLDWANMDTEQRRAAVKKFAQSAARSLLNGASNLKRDAKLTLHEDRSPSAKFDVSNGSLSIEIGTNVDFDGLSFKDSGEAVLSQAFAAIEEEFMHAAHGIAAFERWKKSDSEAEFRDWFEQESFKDWQSIFTGIGELRSSGNNEAADVIEDAIFEATRLYHQDVPLEMLGTLMQQQRPAYKMYLEFARMLAQVQLDSFTTETEFTRFVKAVNHIFTKVLGLMRKSAELVKTGALGEALKRDVDTLASSIRQMRQDAALIEESQKQPPAATYADAANDPNVLIDSLGEEQLQQGIEVREKAPEPLPFGSSVVNQIRQSKQKEISAYERARERFIANAIEGSTSKSDSTGRRYHEAARVYLSEVLPNLSTGNLPISVRYDTSVGAGTRANALNDGSVEIIVGAAPEGLFKNKKDAKLFRSTVASIIDEEVIHAVQMLSAPKMGSLHESIVNDSNSILSEALQNDLVSDAADKALDVYFRGEAENAAVKNPDSFRISAAYEFVRMLVQQQRTGTQSESFDDDLKAEAIPFLEDMRQFAVNILKTNEGRDIAPILVKRIGEINDLIDVITPQKRKSILRQNDGSVIRTGVTQRAAEAARNSYDGVIPGVADTWMGTVAEFEEQFPNGVSWGGWEPAMPSSDQEAGVAIDGRAYIFLDRVYVLEGDLRRAEQYGTSVQGEAVKRLLRHESFGHRGAMALPAPLRNRFVDMIASGIIPEAELDYLVDERGYSTYAGWRNDIAKQIMLGEEWLAHKMEGIRAIPQSGPMAQMMDWLRDVWAWLTGAEKAMLPELRDMMREMHRALGALKPWQRIVAVGDARASRAASQSPQAARHAALEAKFNAGTITAEETAEAEAIVAEAARGAGYDETMYHGSDEYRDEFEGGAFFTDDKVSASGYARLRSIYNSAQSNDDLMEIISEVMSDEDMEDITDMSPDTVLDIADANGFKLDSSSGFVFKGFLKSGNTLDLSDIGSSGSIKEAWNFLHDKGLIDESWSDMDEDMRDEVLEQYRGKAYYRLLEGENVFSKAFSNGFDTVKFEDQDVTGKDTHLSWLTKTPEQFKSAAPFTGVPLDQRFQSTSNDIRYSRQGPIRNQPAPLTSQETKNTAPNSAIRSIAEMQAGLDGVMEVLPTEYHTLANENGAQDALKAYADDLIAPYKGSVEKLRKLLSIVKRDELLSSELKIGARSGSVVMPSLLNKAAILAAKLGNESLRMAFMRQQTAFASSAGQDLWANKAVKMDTEFSNNYVNIAMDDTDVNSVKVTVDPLINTKGNKTVNDTLDNAKLAGDEAADAVAAALEDEAMISMRVLELGALAQEDTELRVLLEELIATTIDLGELAEADIGRASIAGRRTPLKFANAAERDAAIDKLKTRQTEILAAIKAKIAKPKKPKAPKTEAATKEPKAPKEKQLAKEKEAKPVQTAKQIINKIIAAAQRKEKKPADIDKVRELYRLDLKKPMDEADFVAKAKEAGLDAPLAVELKDAIDLELTAIAIEAAFRAESSEQDRAIKKAEEELNRYQKQAESKINEIADALADPSLTKDKQKAINPFKVLYDQQIKNPLSMEQFVIEMSKLNVFEQTAKQLFDIAAMDTQAREAIQAAKDDARIAATNIKKRNVSEARASELIYTQEEQLRQGSKDREESKSGDSINKAFRDQVSKPMALDAFIARLDKLKVSAKTAERLFKTAGRVAMDDEMANLMKKRNAFLDIDSSALAAFINKMRASGKMTGKKKAKWGDILSLPVADQETMRAELLDRISKHDALRNLSTGEQIALADALDAVWQRERRKIFKRMIKRADMKGVDKATQEKIANATPALLKFINQGMLGSDAFYLALGEQFNIQRISKEDRAKVEQLAAEMQAPDVTTMERTIKSEQIAKILQKNSTMSYAELASSVWVVHVLTGGATLLDMGLGFMTGALSVIKKAINVAAIGKPGLALEGLSDFGRFLWIAGKEAVGNVVRPESGILAAKEASMMAYMQKGAMGAGLTPGDRLQLIRDEPGDSASVKANKKIQRILGRWLSMWERIMGGLDHFNSVATTHGTMRLAAALNPKLYDEALIPSQQDYKNMLARAKARMPDGTPKAQSALARSMIYDGVHLLGKGLEEGKMEQWRNMVFDIRGEGFTASFQEDPSGLGGILYNGIKSMTDGLEVKTREFRDKQREKFKETRGVGPATLINRAAGEMGYVLATQAQNIMGSRFIRFTGNKLNELISYTPFIGLARLQEAGMSRDGLTNLRAKNIYHNQALSIVALIAYMYMMQRLDDDEEEKKVIVEGSWDNLTPARKSQLMSDGFKPNTIRFKMSNGQWVSGNFTSWPFAGWLAAFGTVSDYKRYTPDKWTEKEAMDKTMLALYSGAFAITDISSLSQLMEMFGKSTYSTDPVKTANERFVKGTTSFLGGFFPRIAKDIDSWFDHTAYKPKDTWEHLAKEVPYLRRSSGAPIRDIFYEKVEVTRSPWSRAIKVSPDDSAYQKLARLNSRGIWLTPPNPENRKVRRGGATRALTEDEAAAYMSETGTKYKEFIMKRGDALAKMDADRAADLIEKTTARIREIALKRAIARGGKAVTVEAE